MSVFLFFFYPRIYLFFSLLCQCRSSASHRRAAAETCISAASRRTKGATAAGGVRLVPSRRRQAVLKCSSLGRADNRTRAPAASLLVSVALEHSARAPIRARTRWDPHINTHTHTYAHRHRRRLGLPAERAENEAITRHFARRAVPARCHRCSHERPRFKNVPLTKCQDLQCL